MMRVMQRTASGRGPVWGAKGGSRWGVPHNSHTLAVQYDSIASPGSSEGQHEWGCRTTVHTASMRSVSGWCTGPTPHPGGRSCWAKCGGVLCHTSPSSFAPPLQEVCCMRPKTQAHLGLLHPGRPARCLGCLLVKDEAVDHLRVVNGAPRLGDDPDVIQVEPAGRRECAIRCVASKKRGAWQGPPNHPPYPMWCMAGSPLPPITGPLAPHLPCGAWQGPPCPQSPVPPPPSPMWCMAGPPIHHSQVRPLRVDDFQDRIHSHRRQQRRVL